MCTQSVGLVAGGLEARGIATVCVALVRSVAVAVRPPRALAVPFPFGRPLGRAGDAVGQRAIVARALALLEAPGPAPVLEDWAP
jgi:hypothetical protein